MIYVTLRDALFIEPLTNKDTIGHVSNYGRVVKAPNILLIEISLCESLSLSYFFF